MHSARPKHNPVSADVREFPLDGFHYVEGGFGPSVEDAAEGGWSHVDGLGKLLLGHSVRLHYLSDTVFHFSDMVGLWQIGAFCTLIFRFTKVKHKFVNPKDLQL